MLRIYCNHPISTTQLIPIEEDFHYIIHVHRLKLNDELICFNNQQEYLCKITQVKKHTLLIQPITLLRSSPPPHPIRLVMSMIKSKRLKWVIEKAVEIGVCEILLAHTHRSQSYELSLDKLYAIAKQALQQSNNMIMPKIEYISMQDLVSRNYNMCILSPDGLHISTLIQQHSLSEQQSSNNSIHSTTISSLSSTNMQLDTVFIGPEGGFTSSELSIAKPHQSDSSHSTISLDQPHNSTTSHTNKIYPRLKLGNTILRSETAAILAIHTLQYFLQA